MSICGTLFGKLRAVGSGIASFTILVGLCTLTPHSTVAETITVGTFRLVPYGEVFIAKERGYFADEGLDVQLVTFSTAQAAALGVVSGNLDFGLTGTSAAMFSLGVQGALRIVGGVHREAPGFPSGAFVASNKAYAAGLKSFKDIGGHTFVIGQQGAPNHYGLGLIAEKFGINLNTIQIVALQSMENHASALAGGTADSGIVGATLALPLLDRGEVKLIGWVGDEVQWQLGVIITRIETANKNPELVRRFLHAVRKALRDYHDAFTDPDEHRKDGPTAPYVSKLLEQFTGLGPVQIERGISYVDAEARVDAKDIAHQITWFKSQNMLKGTLDPDVLIDKRFAITLQNE